MQALGIIGSNTNEAIQRRWNQDYYAEKMGEVFQNEYLYPNVGLLGHAAAWFNLANTPGLPIQPSEALKWQVLFVAKAYMNPFEQTYEAFNLKPFGKCTLAEGFTLDYLAPNDIVLFYRILVSFLDAESARGNFFSSASTLSRYHLGLLGDYVLKKCKDREFSDQIKQCIDFQQDPNALSGLQLRVTLQSDLYEKLSVQGKRQAVFVWLDGFYHNLKEEPEWRKEVEFYSFLKVLDQVCPELEVFTYFVDFGNGSMIANIPDMAGVRTLFEHFNTKEKDSFKYKGKLDEVVVTDLTHFPDYLRQLEEDNFQGIKKFEVLNGGKSMGRVGGHFDPVFVRRIGTAITLIITDSAPFESVKDGKITPNYWLPFLNDAVEQAKLSNVKKYTFFPARQGDNLSCPILSLRDILESCKTDLFAYVDSLPPDQISEKNGFFVIKQFPPNFMKVKQSVTYIDAYETSVTSAKTMVVASKAFSVLGAEVRYDKTLRMVVNDHTVTRNGKKENFYLRERCFKYFGIIIRNLVHSKLSSP